MTEIWEYKIVTSSMNTPGMNELGEKGWENYSNVFNEHGIIEKMYWKRPLK